MTLVSNHGNKRQKQHTQSQPEKTLHTQHKPYTLHTHNINLNTPHTHNINLTNTRNTVIRPNNKKEEDGAAGGFRFSTQAKRSR